MRAAQGQHEEAEALLREAYDIIGRTEHRLTQRQALEALAQFLLERGHDEEAADLESRRERLLADAESAAKIA